MPDKIIHRLLGGGLVLGFSALAGCVPPAACTCDLSVANLEVTQGIQIPLNGTQLVAQRGTAVRATVALSGATAPITGATGRLHVLVNGTEITPTAGVAPLNGSFTAPLSPLRANENDTLNFELPAPTGIGPSTNVTFRVDLTPATGETNTGNNSLTTPSLTFVARTTPSLFYTAIDYTPAGAGLPSAGLIASGSGDLFVRGIVPVNDGDPNLYRRGFFPTLTFTQDGNGDLRLNGTDGNDLMSLLASCRQLIVSKGLGANSNTFLYGWIAGNPIDGNGLGQVGGNNAFGNTDLTRGQRSYAHELTHNFGLNHNSRSLDQVGWDVGGRLENNWAGNGVTGRVKPTSNFDIQNAGRLTNQAWVDVTTYNLLLANPVFASRDSALAALFMERLEPQQGVAVVQGIFDPLGTALRILKPVFRFPWASEPTNPDQPGQFIVEITDETGAVTTRRFDALVADDPDEGEEQEVTGFFEVMVPVDPARAIQSLRILDESGQREFGSFRLSQPPQIRVSGPADGAQLGDRTEVSWELSDPDTSAEELLLQVAYSPDGGESWVPVAVDVPGNLKSISFDSTQIQKSDGQGVIRVFVSDGLNTVFADATNLTPSAAAFPAP